MDVLECPYCGGMINENDYCYHCQKQFTADEIQNIKDVEMMNEDMEIWRMTKQFKGRS